MTDETPGSGAGRRDETPEPGSWGAAAGGSTPRPREGWPAPGVGSYPGEAGRTETGGQWDRTAWGAPPSPTHPHHPPPGAPPQGQEPPPPSWPSGSWAAGGQVPYPGGAEGPATRTLTADQPPRRSGTARILVLALAAALLGGVVGGVVSNEFAGGRGSPGVLAQPLPSVDEAAAPIGPVEEVAARVLPSVVQLRVESPLGSGEGSGMVLSPDGLLLTNNHVIETAARAGTITVLFQDGATATAQIVGRDPSSDLAVLRARGVSGLVPIELGNSDAVRVGQQVVAFGSPLGLGGTVTTGIVSALDRAVSVGGESGASEATVLNALQTDAAINPGNSGGPLTDMQGRLIGINSAIATTGVQGGSIGLGFSIPVNQAKRIAEELERTGQATRAVLGVNLTTGGTETGGAVIGQVVPGGPADQAGLRAGQVVTRVNDRIITNGNELVAAIRDQAPGDRVTLTVDGQQVEVTLAGQTG
ncbi:MAG TPA: trypsin-like peptidase domain-containing protein [Pseudonocardia sp.]|nr:trypsin-like peptidase domain-containing protein [Pseudonocardia sp.]